MLQRKCRLGEMTMPGIILFTMIRTLSSKVDRTIAALTDAAEKLACSEAEKSSTVCDLQATFCF